MKSQVVHSTIAKDLENSNAKVHEAATDLRKERIRLIKLKAKEITGEDIDIEIGEINTDVKVGVNVNELARTEGIVSVSSLSVAYLFTFGLSRIPACSPP